MPFSSQKQDVHSVIIWVCWSLVKECLQLSANAGNQLLVSLE
jgi:hypothetical protein